MRGSRIRNRGVGAVLALVGVCVALAPAAHADPASGRLALESARKGTGTCQDLSAVCLPEGIYTITIGNSNPAACRFDVNVSWGDGATDHYVLGPGRDVSHQYGSPGVYTISISGVGTPLQPDTTCTGASGSVKVEVPVGAGLSPEVAELLGGILGLAGDFDRDLDKFLKLKLNKESKKLRARVDELVRDGKQAKSLSKDYRRLDVAQEGDVVFPCPTSRPRDQKRGCAGEVAEKLEDLWGFLKSLQELANYPEYQRKRADAYYTTQEGQARMDHLAALNYGANQRYSELNGEQKQVVASQVQVHDGAINKALRDAQKAGKAGAEVAF